MSRRSVHKPLRCCAFYGQGCQPELQLLRLQTIPTLGMPVLRALQGGGGAGPHHELAVPADDMLPRQLALCDCEKATGAPEGLSCEKEGWFISNFEREGSWVSCRIAGPDVRNVFYRLISQPGSWSCSAQAVLRGRVSRHDTSWQLLPYTATFTTACSG